MTEVQGAQDPALLLRTTCIPCAAERCRDRTAVVALRRKVSQGFESGADVSAHVEDATGRL